MKKIIFVTAVYAALLAGQVMADQTYIGCSKWGWADAAHYDNSVSQPWWGAQMLTGYDYNYNAGSAAVGYIQIDMSGFNPTLLPGESLVINSVQLDMWEYINGCQWTGGTPFATDELFQVADWAGNITNTNKPALGTLLQTISGSLPWSYGSDADAKIIGNSAATQAYILGELAGDKIVSFGVHAPAGIDTKSWHSYQTGPGSMRVTIDYTISQIPEPATMTILGLGVLGMLRRRK